MREAHRIFLATSIAISVLLREAQALRKKPAGSWVFFSTGFQIAVWGMWGDRRHERAYINITRRMRVLQARGRNRSGSPPPRPSPAPSSGPPGSSVVALYGYLPRSITAGVAQPLSEFAVFVFFCLLCFLYLFLLFFTFFYFFLLFFIFY